METLERFSPPPPPPPSILHSSNLDNKISPSILLIIIILAIIFFISSLLHLLVRFLLKPNNNNNRGPDELDDDATVLQGQLQQLFYLHDAGVDQSFIDTLPLFHYSSVIGVKDPFDCAVCLSEFEPDDRLRLLPKCSHAFHTQCIDMWFFSHSTCPLCRSNPLDGFSPRSGKMPVVCVLESGSDGSRKMGIVDRDEQVSGSVQFEFPRKSSEISVKEVDAGDKIVTVKLGKFRNVDGSGESSGTTAAATEDNNVVNSRRCYSMGSFAYVMDENSSLRVPIMTPLKKPISKKPGMAVSEYWADSRREFSGIQIHENDKIESFPISKNWVRDKWGGAARRTNSEIDIINGGDEETLSCYSVESTATATSTTKRTLLWLMGRHLNKVVHTSISSSSNI